MTIHLATCAICSNVFESRTSYGLCSRCWQRDRIREWDRLQSARRHALRAHLDADLTLVQWLATLSEFNGMCAFCLEAPGYGIAMVNPIAGLTWDNVVPICKPCSVHLRNGFDQAKQRVQSYLTDKADQDDDFDTKPLFAMPEEEDDTEPEGW